jgi:hypothetical protein
MDRGIRAPFKQQLDTVLVEEWRFIGFAEP